MVRLLRFLEYQFAEIASVEVARLYEGKYQGNEAYCEQLQQEVCGLRVQVESAYQFVQRPTLRVER